MDMDIIFGASIIASFLAGGAALFAPCCITVLLPAYLGSVFKEKKKILKMTLVFFFGLSVVLIPIGLGAAYLAEFFKDFHRELYLFGGAFMIVLAVLSVFGKGMSFMPSFKKIPDVSRSGAKSVFVLGVFSGAATSCCAPVLAGAVTLALVSQAFFKALIVVFAYVFGMIFPLFIAAYFYDKFKINESRFIMGKIFEFKMGAKNLYVHSTNLFAAAVFFIMGVTLILLGFSNNAFWSPQFQSKLGMSLNSWSMKAFNALGFIPEFLWALFFVGLFVFLIYKSKNNS